MGNYMYLGEAEFSIPEDKEEALTQLLRDAAIRDIESGSGRASELLTAVYDKGRVVDTFTLDELFTCWGWSLIRDYGNDSNAIDDIKLDEDYSSTEDRFFGLIAPYVEAGSYITLSGSQYGENWEWRYGFTGKRVEQLFAEYPPVPIEKEEHDATNRRSS